MKKDEYIAVADVNHYRSDMDCFVPLIEQFHKIYGFYPKYPVADAGYGSYNNYIYCEQKGMEQVRLEIFLVSIGHNLYKYHNKINRTKLAA